jgi:hypothetical protein
MERTLSITMVFTRFVLGACFSTFSLLLPLLHWDLWPWLCVKHRVSEAAPIELIFVIDATGKQAAVGIPHFQIDVIFFFRELSNDSWQAERQSGR